MPPTRGYRLHLTSKVRRCSSMHASRSLCKMQQYMMHTSCAIALTTAKASVRLHNASAAAITHTARAPGRAMAAAIAANTAQ
eukprot:14307-Heterococcus_DN1.PRE.2